MIRKLATASQRTSELANIRIERMEQMGTWTLRLVATLARLVHASLRRLALRLLAGKG